MEDVKINYSYIAKAVEHYVEAGFKLIEVPWIVDPEITYYTCGNREKVYTTRGRDLIGSAEQGFISLQTAGKLDPGRYVSVSPCFRYGDSLIDEFHKEYFMKVELFSNLGVIEDELDFMVLKALVLFKKLGANNISRTGTFCFEDITINGIEVGSYGYRVINRVYVTYGTGLAEPRFSMALKRINNESLGN